MCACSMSDNQRHCVAVTYAVIRKVSGYLAQFTLLTRLDRGLKCASSLDGARGAIHRCGTNFLSSVELQYLSLH